MFVASHARTGRAAGWHQVSFLQTDMLPRGARGREACRLLDIERRVQGPFSRESEPARCARPMPEMDTLRPAGPAATHCPYCALQCGMHVARRRGRRSTVVGNADVPGQQGRPLREGLVGRRDARASRSAARAAGARRRTGALEAGDVGRRARRDRGADSRESSAPRPRRGRRVRRRRADQREGLPARQVRARRARHVEHRLQRPLLHVVGGGGRDRARSASTAACRFRSRTSPRADVDPAGRQQRRRDDAADHAVLRAQQRATAAR